MKTIQYHLLAITVGFLCWLVPSSIMAYDVEIDGIYYDLDTSNKKATVTNSGSSGCYFDSVDIPASITSGGITYSVTSVGSCAFLDCSELWIVTIPNSVTTIGASAFERCTGLSYLSIGKGVVTISYEAFKGCCSLSIIVLPASLKTIENEAFSGCTSLNKIIEQRETAPSIVNTTFNGVDKNNCILYVPDGCQSAYSRAANWNSFFNIDDSGILVTGPCGSNIWNDISSATVFYTIYCDMRMVISGTGMMFDHVDSDYCVDSNYRRYVETVIIEEGVTYIGDRSFPGFIALNSVTIPNSVRTIGYLSFSDCTSLTSVTIPGSVTSIRDYAFSCDDGLSSITCESKTPVEIASSVFYNVDKTTCTLYVPKGSKSAYENAEGWSEFQNIVEYTPGLHVLATGSCGDNVNYIIFSDMTMVVSGTGQMKDYNYSEHINDEYYESIQEVIIKEGVTSIGDCAFNGCIGLTSVTIPSSVTSIGNGAFWDCTGLTSIEIPNSVTSIGPLAFYSCLNLGSISFGNGLSSIGDGAFDSTAWYDNQPIGLVYAGPVLYDYNDGPYSGEGTYYDALSEEIIIKDGTVAICPSAFFFRNYHEKGDVGLFSFASITIPESLTYLQPICQYSYIFMNADNICVESSINAKSISVDPNNPIFDSRDNCNAIIETSTNKLIVGNENTIIPNGVTTIGAFSIGRLTSVSIPASVILIEEGAFSPMHLRREPELGGDIEENYLSSPVEVIKMEGMTPPIVGLEGVNTTSCTLYVPEGSKSAYENAEGWSEFANIVEYEPDTDISALDNAIYVEQTEGRIGGTKDISVKMKNDFDVRGFQFTMELPEGTTINGWTLNQGRMPAGTTMNKVFATEGIDENEINVVCALNDGEKTFTGNDGLIATVNVSFAEDMEEGMYPIYLTKNSISDATAQTQLVLSDIKSTLVLEDYVLGDTNGDGMVLVGDVISILNYIVGSPSTNFNAKAADVNGDGKILVGDVIAVLNIIVNQ